MIVKHFDLQKNLKKNKYFLLYGNNKGLIEETLEKTIKPLLKGSIFSYEESEIIKNSETFQENIYNKSFFENEKLILISRASDKILQVVQTLIEKNIDGVYVAIIASTLEKKSKLRSFFEKSKNTICVPFYEDNQKILSLLAFDYFKEKKISFSQQNINLLVERCRGDRSNLFNELNKIESFLKNKKQINTEEILKLTNLSENYDLAELVDYSLAKNQKKLLNIINENNFGVEDSILILRIYIRKLKRLLKIHLQNIKDQNIEKSIANFKPPIFWKEKDVLRDQLKILNLSDVKQLLIKVNEIELSIKQHPANSINLVTNFVLEQTNS